MRENKVYIGFTNTTKMYGSYTVVEKHPNQRYTVQFDNGYLLNTCYKHVLDGVIKNPTYPSIRGVACVGVGHYTAKDGSRNSPAYEVWGGIIKRCYSSKSKSFPIYGGVGAFVCEEWLNFQNFAKWFYSHDLSKEVPMWSVDKDLAFISNKEYCPDKCNMVPFSVNSLFTGAKVVTGATFSAKSNKWIAQIQRGRIGGTGKKRQCNLGTYHTEQEAIEAYTIAKIEHCAKVAEANKDYIPQVIFNNLTCEDYVRAVLLEKRNLL